MQSSCNDYHRNEFINSQGYWSVADIWSIRLTSDIKLQHVIAFG